MTRLRVKLAIGVALLGVVVTATAAVAGQQSRQFRASMNGFKQVPALSTPGIGSFRATINRAGTAVRWELSYEGLQQVQQAHIHFEKRTNSGPVVVFLCSNLPNAPAGTPECPPSGTVSGTLTADEVTPLAAEFGIAAREIGEVIAAIRAGAMYVNVHTAAQPGGEIRGQIRR